MQCTFIAKEGGTNQVVGIPFRHCPEAYSSKALHNVPSAMRHDCFRSAKKKKPTTYKAQGPHQPPILSKLAADARISSHVGVNLRQMKICLNRAGS